MNRTISRLGLAGLALVAGSVTLVAQTATSGAITGVVRDANGGVLAGATVTATSAQLTRTTVTGADGSYRLSLLNPGEWNVKASKGGSSSSSQRVTVLLNNSTSANFKVVGEASAVVVVVATAAALDQTTTQTGSVMQIDRLDGVPKGRDFNTLVALAPGTVGGGAMGGSSISGASAIENNFVVDGLDTTDYRLGFQGSAMPTDWMDQVEVQTGGFRPEYSAFGGVISAITKSGTNTFAGSAWVTSDAAQLQGRTERNNYYQSAPPNYRYDYGFTLGGAIIPDKFFYFVGFNEIDLESIPTTNLSGLTDSAAHNKQTNAYAKFNYFISQNQQLTGTIQYTRDPIDQDHQYPGALGNRDFGFSQTNNTTKWSLNYDWTINPTLLLSLKYGASVSASHTTPTSALPSITDYLWFNNTPVGFLGAGSMGPGHNDPTYAAPYGTNIYRHGGIGDWNDTTDSNDSQARIDLSWFLGDHSLKFGLSHTSANSDVLDYLAADDRVTISSSRVTDTTYANLGSKATLIADAFYVQDQWELTPGFRLSYGFREEYQTVKGNRDQTIFKFTNFSDQLQPRIGLTWDVNNDGKTKLSANFAIYNERFPMQAALRTGGNETYQQYRFSFASGSATYNAATGGYTHVPFDAAHLAADYSGFFRDDPQPLDGLKVPKRSEIVLGVDHTFGNGVTAGLHGKYRKLLRMIEDTVPTDNMGNPVDGAGFSILWNPQAGKTYTWANNQYIALFGGTPGALNTWTNTVFPDPKNIYSSVDLTLDKKTERYTLSFNFTWSHVYGNYEGVGQTSNGQSDANITSTWDYAPYVGNGPLPLDHRYNAKLYGSYTWDLGGGALTAGGSVRYLSGAPRTFFDDGTATLAANPGAAFINGLSTANGLDWGGYGNATPFNFEYGTNGRLPSTTIVDLHFDYAFKFSNKVKLVPSIDIFNAANTRTVTGIDDYGTTAAALPNAGYGYANAWLAGRSYRWGVKVSF